MTMETRYTAEVLSKSYQATEVARDIGNLPRQLYSTLEGQMKTEEILRGVLHRLRGPGAPTANSSISGMRDEQPEPDDVMSLAQRSGQHSNTIAELVSEISNYI